MRWLYNYIYILSWCYSFHPCHPFAGHAGLFAGHDTHGTHIGHLSLKSSKVRSLLALSVTMRRSIFGLLWFLESGHSTQTISNPVGISWHLTCTAVRCVLIVSCRQRIWQETCLCTQIGAPSGWFLTIFGSICLEKWLNYVELVCEELSEIVGCFSYVMLYMCKKLAWAFAQLAAFDRKPLDAYPVFAAMGLATNSLKAIVLVCYSFHPCHPFAGHAGLFCWPWHTWDTNWPPQPQK